MTAATNDPADVIEVAAKIALDAMEAKQRADKEAVRAALGDLAVDLDGKEHDYRVEAWEVARALHAAGLLHTAQDDLDLGDAERIKAERDELRATVERAEAEVAKLQRMLETAQAERDMKVSVREALHYRDQRDELRATVDRVAMLRNRWARMADEAMDVDTRELLDAASKTLRDALDGGEQR